MANQAEIKITVKGEDVEININGDSASVMYGIVSALTALYSRGGIPEKLVDDLPMLIRTEGNGK